MKEYIVAEHPDFPYEEPKPQELIRCKDCRHAHKGAFNPGYKRCDYNGEIKSPQDYCSWAERRNPDV